MIMGLISSLSVRLICVDTKIGRLCLDREGVVVSFVELKLSEEEESGRETEVVVGSNKGMQLISAIEESWVWLVVRMEVSIYICNSGGGTL